MTQAVSEELQKQIREILDACKKRDAENAEVLALVKKDIENIGKVDEGRKDAIAALTKTGQELQGRLHDLEQKIAKGEEKPARELSIGEQFTLDPDFAKFAKNAKSVG